MVTRAPAVRGVAVSPEVVLGSPELVLIAGPCVLESEGHALGLGRAIAAVAARVGVPYVFKASFDKANRSSSKSFDFEWTRTASAPAAA